MHIKLGYCFQPSTNKLNRNKDCTTDLPPDASSSTIDDVVSETMLNDFNPSPVYYNNIKKRNEIFNQMTTEITDQFTVKRIRQVKIIYHLNKTLIYTEIN